MDFSIHCPGKASIRQHWKVNTQKLKSEKFNRNGKICANIPTKVAKNALKDPKKVANATLALNQIQPQDQLNIPPAHPGRKAEITTQRKMRKGKTEFPLQWPSTDWDRDPKKSYGISDRGRKWLDNPDRRICPLLKKPSLRSHQKRWRFQSVSLAQLSRNKGLASGLNWHTKHKTTDRKK